MSRRARRQRERHHPNLAGQKARYIELQLNALKDGSRKNALMNAIAAQLSTEDIANLAAHFSAQQGATAGAKSDFLPNVAKTNVPFPENYKSTFTKYHTINFPDTRQVRYYYANDTALQAAKAGKSLPDGSILFAEVYAAKLDADKKPSPAATASSWQEISCSIRQWGARPAGARTFPTCCATRTGTMRCSRPQKSGGAGVNQAECLACHKPLDKVSYTFTLKQLADAGKTK
jgi:hypothetical protein